MSGDIKQHLAEAAINIVTGARRGSYGKPENNFGRIALLWQAWFEARGWAIVDREHASMFYDGMDELKLSAADVSPMMRLMKEARLCETPNHYDSHLDIIGYAMTGAEVNGVESPKNAEQIEQQRVFEIEEAALDKLRTHYDSYIAALQKKLDDAIREQLPASSDPETASSLHARLNAQPTEA